MTLQSVGAAVFSSAAVAVIGTDPTSWQNFAEKFGITAALLLYFVIRDHYNYRRSLSERAELILRIQTLEREQKDELTAALNRSTDAIEGCLQKQMASGLRRAIKAAREDDLPDHKHG